MAIVFSEKYSKDIFVIFALTEKKLLVNEIQIQFPKDSKQSE